MNPDAPIGAAIGPMPAAILGAAALVLHLGLLATAPILLRVVQTVRLWPDEPFGTVLADLRDDLHRLARPAGGITAPGEAMIVPSLVLCFVAATFACWLTVPSFAAALPVPAQGDIVELALLIGLGLLASLLQAAASGGPAAIGTGIAGPLVLCFAPAAMLVAGLDLATIGATGTPVAPPAQALLIVALGLVALADLGLVETLDRGLSDPWLGLYRLALAGRTLFWLDLVASVCPPSILTVVAAGPLSWLGSLIAWAIKVTCLAVLLGLIRRWTGGHGARANAAALLGGACVLGLLASAFLLIGPALE